MFLPSSKSIATLKFDRKSKIILFATAFVLGLTSQTSANPQETDRTKKHASDWKFALGAAARYFADYEGSDDYDLKPLPLVNISWRNIVSIGSVGGPGLRVKFLKIKGPKPKDHLTLSSSLGYFGGRDQDANDALQGLGDLDGGLTGKLSADYQFQNFGSNFSVERDLSGDREGTTIDAGLRYSFALGSPKTQLTLGSSVTWADDNYMENTFGISRSQSANSVLGYSATNAAAGFKDAGATVSVRHFWSQNVAVLGQVGYKHLLADAAESPIVDGQGSAGQFSALVGISYNW